MSPKRGDRVAPPPAADEWSLRFGSTDAAKGWESRCSQAAGNLRKAWEQLATDPRPRPPSQRQHPLKGSLATGAHGGRRLEQWQFEITGAGRIWYLVDPDRHTIWIVHAGTGHPKATE